MHEQIEVGERTRRWFIQTRCEAVAQTLRKNGIQATYAQTKDEAKRIVLEMIPEGASVGIAGSITVRELGLIEALEEKGHQLFHHWKPGLTNEESLAERKKENLADFLLASCNAVTIDGKLINGGCTGNRIAGMMFGPKKVILIVSYQKIVKDIEAGIWRIKNVVTPMNAKRHGRDLPCAETTFCVDCKSKERQDCFINIIEMKPWTVELKVILVGEELGF
jgi:hypothetical protein